MLVGFVAQAGQRGTPRHAVGLEHLELFGCRLAVDFGLHVLLELPVRERLQRRRCAHPSARSPDEGRASGIGRARPASRSPMYPRIYLRWTTRRTPVLEVWGHRPVFGIG